MKKISTVLLTVYLSIIFATTALARPIMDQIPEKPVVDSEAAFCIDADTGKVYYAKNPDKRMYPASTTKMMTAILALEMGDLNAVTTVSENAGYTDEGQDIGLSPGDRIKLSELIRAALMHSANDSTVAIGEQVGGTEPIFLRMMNLKAQAIGAWHTQYTNTNGYSDLNHYTTARDLATIARYGIYHNNIFRKLVNTREGAIKWQSKGGAEKKHDLYNTNRLLHLHDWIDGVKTGTTPLAGNCLVAYGRKEGRNIITVVLNSGNRYQDSLSMFNYAFRAYSKIQVVRQGEEVGSVPVQKGKKPSVRVKSQGSFAITIPIRELNQLKREIIPMTDIQAPVKAGQEMGTLKVTYKGKVIYQTKVTAAIEVEKKGFFRRLREGF